jgi:hypothetical protein
MQNLRFKFEGSDSLINNCSQAGQDLFVLAALNGKRNGVYLEVGAGPADQYNNTYILETEFGWRGVSVEFNQGYFIDHRSKRKHYIELVDGTSILYGDLLARGNITETEIDYASLDLDHSDTLVALLNLPMETHKFATITYEHDEYIYGSKYLVPSRRYLTTMGYELVASNIMATGFGSFEDWWVHPDLVNRETIDKMKSIGEEAQEWTSYIFN